PKFQSTRPTWGATTEYDFTVALSVFQSTRPTWGATLAVGSCICSTRFQSTRPTWGATTWTSAPHLALYVSIHAHHVGRDSAYRERGQPVVVSIHAPHVGRDGTWAHNDWEDAVSIHAPHVGRDLRHAGRFDVRCGFNPRAPRGARRNASAPSPISRCFNPRAPRGARLSEAEPDF